MGRERYVGEDDDDLGGDLEGTNVPMGNDILKAHDDFERDMRHHLAKTVVQEKLTGRKKSKAKK